MANIANLIGKPKVNPRIVDKISPVGIDFQKTHFIYEDKYCCAITILKYPTRVGLGWLSSITTMKKCTASIEVSVTNKEQLLQSLNKSINEFSSRELSNRTSHVDAVRYKRAKDDALEMIDDIELKQSNVIYVTITIIVKADTLKELEFAKERVLSQLAGKQMRGAVMTNRQEAGLIAGSPYAETPTELVKDYGRNMPTGSLAAGLPFYSSGINDGKGIVLGVDGLDGMVNIDMWNSGKPDRVNRNGVILGMPGTGKSTLVKKLFLNEFAKKRKVIVIDPEQEYLGLARFAGSDGQIINPMTAQGLINPLEIKDDTTLENAQSDLEIRKAKEEIDNAPSNDEKKLAEAKLKKLQEEKSRLSNPLATQIRNLRTFFRLYLKGLTENEMGLLEIEIEKTYNKKGIDWDTKPTNIRKDQYPTMSDLYETVEKSFKKDKREEYETLLIRLRPAALGADKIMFNGHTQVQAKADFIVIDISELHNADDVIKRTQYWNILGWAWREIQKARATGEEILLCVDEVHMLIDPDTPEPLKKLKEFSKRIRKYNGGLWTITHSVVDMISPEAGSAGQALLDNPCYKFIFGTDGQNLEDLKRIFPITENEANLLEAKQRGRCILFAGSQKIDLKVKVSEKELEIMGNAGGK